MPTVLQIHSKLYAVVEFRNENAVEIVATKWLINDEGRLKCYWPPGGYSKARQMAVKQCDADPSIWNCYNVKLVHATSMCYLFWITC